MKPRSFFLPKNPTITQRSFVIVSGPGTSPESNTRRTVRGTWLSDGAPDTISSYDFQYVINPKGVKVERLPEPEVEITPVKLATELAPGLPDKEELKAKVRRKR